MILPIQSTCALRVMVAIYASTLPELSTTKKAHQPLVGRTLLGPTWLIPLVSSAGGCIA